MCAREVAPSYCATGGPLGALQFTRYRVMENLYAAAAGVGGTLIVAFLRLSH